MFHNTGGQAEVGNPRFRRRGGGQGAGPEGGLAEGVGRLTAYFVDERVEEKWGIGIDSLLCFQIICFPAKNQRTQMLAAENRLEEHSALEREPHSQNGACSRYFFSSEKQRRCGSQRIAQEDIYETSPCFDGGAVSGVGVFPDSFSEGASRRMLKL